MSCEILVNSLIKVLILAKCCIVFPAPRTSICLIFICFASALASKRIAYAFWRYGSLIIAVIGLVASILLCLQEIQIICRD